MAIRKVISGGKRALVRVVPAGAGKPGNIRVSVIIPVYNTETYLRELLESLVAQDLPRKKFEVIAVNDGSTDASGKILDEYANRYPHFHVIHQENSGWAGKPRNVALDVAQGRYVFFADSDDVLAPSALRRLAGFASKHQVDVVFPKVVGIGGRTVTKGLYSKTNPSISPSQAIKSLTPQKLISRELIETHRLRFPEEPIRLEDGMFMVACYLLAERIGVAADHDLYGLRARADGSNISSRPLDPHGYTTSISRIAGIIRATAKDAGLAQAMMLTLWSNKGLKIYAPRRFKRYSENVQNQWIDAHSDFVNEFIPTESAKNLNDIRLGKTEFIRNRDRQGLLGLIALEEQLELDISITGAHYAEGELRVSGTLQSRDVDSILISARDRGGHPAVLAEAWLPAQNGTFAGTLSGIPEGEATMDFFLKPMAGETAGSSRRASTGTGAAFSSSGRLGPYSTKHGNLSLRPVGG